MTGMAPNKTQFFFGKMCYRFWGYHDEPFSIKVWKWNQKFKQVCNKSCIWKWGAHKRGVRADANKRLKTKMSYVNVAYKVLL